MALPPVSGTVSQTAFPTRLVIEHAYRRCRLQAQQITGEMIDIALDLLYLMLSEWANRKIQLWCIEKNVLALYQGQAQLPCPPGTVDILNQNLRTLTLLDFASTRSASSIVATLNIPDILSGGASGTNTNGVMLTTLGADWSGTILPYTVRASLTPPDPITGTNTWPVIATITPETTNGTKTWNDIDGAGSFKYYQISVAVPTITLAIGAAAGSLQLRFSDGVSGDVSQYFLAAGSFRINGEPQATIFNVISAVYDPANKLTVVTVNVATSSPLLAPGTQILITVPLNIATLYLGNNPYEITLARLNRDDYINLPNKAFQGRPLQFWFDRQRDIPIMTLWPTPDFGSTVNQITIWRKRYIFDVGGVSNMLDIPQRWFDAVVYGLAYRLAEERPEVDMNLIPVLAQRAQQVLMETEMEERDNSPTYWSPNLRVYTA